MKNHELIFELVVNQPDGAAEAQGSTGFGNLDWAAQRKWAGQT